MKTSIHLTALTAALLVLGLVPARAAPAGSVRPTRADAASLEAGTGWIVDRADNICGLSDPKMLSRPAKLDYDALLRATPEMKKIKDDKIDPSSPQGIQLRQAATTRVEAAAEKVRAADGYCSVWKQIRHQDGRAISDITDKVKALL